MFENNKRIYDRPVLNCGNRGTGFIINLTHLHGPKFVKNFYQALAAV